MEIINKKGGKIIKRFNIKKICFSFLLLFLIITISNTKIYANQVHRFVIPGGETIGLKIDTGVHIIGKYEVMTSAGKVKPWENSDILENDIIISINNIKINNNQELLKVLKRIELEEVELELLRNKQIIKTKIKVVKTKDSEKSLGLYIKDKIAGIGTLTFIDPINNRFAALGHGIYEDNNLVKSSNGELVDSKIQSIKKAIPGSSGEKRASLLNNKIGMIKLCSDTGIYGKMNSIKTYKKDKIETARQDETKLGIAYFYTVINDQNIEKYKIEIIEVHRQTDSEPKGIKFRVTDSVLIKNTGGIVQGMSGSPIIQDGKLIGAVSHVNVDNPLIGYGIHIDWMIRDLEKVG